MKVRVKIYFTEKLRGSVECQLIGVDEAGILITQSRGQFFYPWHTISFLEFLEPTSEEKAD